MENTQGLQPDVQKTPPKSKINPWMVSAIILFFALILVAVYALNLDKKQTTPQLSPQLTISPTEVPMPISTPPASESTADWLTYTNTEYGYSIKYPPTLFYKIWDTSKDSKRKHYIVFLLKKYKDKNIPQPPEIGLVTYENSKKLPLRDWLDEHTDLQGASVFEKVVNLKQVTIGDASALRFVEESSLWGITAPTVLISRNDEIFKLFYTNAYSKDDLSKIFNQILSTLKFLDQNQPETTEGWKTYTNKEYNFSFSYPQSWQQYQDKTSPSIVNIDTNINSGYVEGPVKPGEPITFNLFVNIVDKSLYNNWKKKAPSKAILNISELKIGNFPAHQTVNFPGGMLESVDTFVEIGDNMDLQITLWPYFETSPTDNQAIIRSQYDQILSTLKFLK